MPKNVMTPTEPDKIPKISLGCSKIIIIMTINNERKETERRSQLPTALDDGYF